MVDNLKVRSTFGLVGSDNTHGYPSNFLYFDKVTLNSVGFNFGDEWLASHKGPVLNQYAVVDPCWERAKNLM